MSVFAMLLGIPWKKMWLGILKSEVWLLAVLKPFGAWGILGLSVIDSAAIPLLFLDPLVVSYGVGNHRMAVIYCLFGALGSAIGSLIPYYVGRAGGELFLLKRINRQRYEALRDRFEKQEFLALMLPAMCPPPMPVKIIEIAAGVFEMRVGSYFLAVLAGKFLRFGIETLLVVYYGPQAFGMVMQAVHTHVGIVLGVVGLGVVWILVVVMRRVFARRRGISLPVEESAMREER